MSITSNFTIIFSTKIKLFSRSENRSNGAMIASSRVGRVQFWRELWSGTPPEDLGLVLDPKFPQDKEQRVDADPCVEEEHCNNQKKISCWPRWRWEMSYKRCWNVFTEEKWSSKRCTYQESQVLAVVFDELHPGDVQEQQEAETDQPHTQKRQQPHSLHLQQLYKSLIYSFIYSSNIRNLSVIKQLFDKFNLVIILLVSNKYFLVVIYFLNTLLR